MEYEASAAIGAARDQRRWYTSAGMPRKNAHGTEPSLSNDVALRALEKQLSALDGLKGRKCDEVEMDEERWEQLTQSIIERTFGNPSTNVDKFHSARWAGSHNMMGVSSQQQQQNYELRMQRFDVLLRGLIDELKLLMPEEKIKGVYEPGDEYGFYRDLSDLIAKAENDILIVDAYVDENIFDLYASKVSPGVTLRILTRKVGSNFDPIAKMYAKSKPLSVKITSDIHDRQVFIDHRGWIVGQSIKDAAKKKPTYVVELSEPLLTASRDIHHAIWSKAVTTI
jgi:hypothetical protein